MYGIQRPAETANPRATQSRWGMPEPLSQMAAGNHALPAAFPLFTCYEDELACAAADLHEREVQALSEPLKAFVLQSASSKRSRFMTLFHAATKS